MSENSGEKHLDKEHDVVKKERLTEHDALEISFDPPVYRQRYSVAFQVIKKYNSKKVLDFGCAECKLLRFLINNETSIEHLVGVDIDGDLLEESKFRIEPLISDYLHPKQAPYTVTTLQGSISQADDRFCNFDLIACIEIIEHLVPEHLEAMPEVLFGQLSPKVAIVTTPNADFNVLFPNLVGFRHWDHKFEWTRQEFQEWATIQSNKYGYNVSFQGIGHGPLGTDHLGCCSQMALFERDDSIFISKDEQSFGQPYQLIKKVEFPYRISTITEEEKILYEVERLLWLWSQPNLYEEELDGESTEDVSPTSFELKRLYEMQSLKKLCGTMERLRSVLESSRFQLTEDGSSILWCRPVWESESEDSVDWNLENTDNTELNPSSIAISDKEPENWDLDEEDCNNLVHSSSDVCWNTITDKDTCQYWDGMVHIESESVLIEDKNTDNDDNNACSFEGCPYSCQLSYSVKSDDTKQIHDLDSDANEQVCDLDDDGLIWITSEDTPKKATNT